MTFLLNRSHAAFRTLCFALFRAKSKEANRMYVTAARIEARRLDFPRQRELTNVTAAQTGATIASSTTRPSRNSSSLSGRLNNEPSVSRIARAVRPTNRQPAKQGRAFWDRLSIWRPPPSLPHRPAAKHPTNSPATSPLSPRLNFHDRSPHCTTRQGTATPRKPRHGNPVASADQLALWLAWGTCRRLLLGLQR